MKKGKILMIITLCFLLAGCKEYGEKRAVNFIAVDSDKIRVYYDDFSHESIVYAMEEKDNTGLSNTLVRLLSEADYDLKLCKYAIISSEILEDKINELYFALTDSRFAPDIVVLEGETDLSPKEYEKIEKTSYPLHNYRMQNNTISCVVERLNDNEKNVIIDNKIYKRLNEQQSFVFDILSQAIKSGTYIYENNNEMLSAELQRINVYHYSQNETLYINVSAVMKSYKGASSNKGDKKMVEKEIEDSINYNIEVLLNDTRITERFDLLWHDNIEHLKRIVVDTNIL